MKAKVCLMENPDTDLERHYAICLMCDKTFLQKREVPMIIDEEDDRPLVFPKGYLCYDCVSSPDDYADKLRQRADEIEQEDKGEKPIVVQLPDENVTLEFLELPYKLLPSPPELRQLADAGIEPPDELPEKIEDNRI